MARTSEMFLLDLNIELKFEPVKSRITLCRTLGSLDIPQSLATSQIGAIVSIAQIPSPSPGMQSGSTTIAIYVQFPMKKYALTPYLCFWD